MEDILFYIYVTFSRMQTFSRWTQARVRVAQIVIYYAHNGPLFVTNSTVRFLDFVYCLARSCIEKYHIACRSLRRHFNSIVSMGVILSVIAIDRYRRINLYV